MGIIDVIILTVLGIAIVFVLSVMIAEYKESILETFAKLRLRR